MDKPLDPKSILLKPPQAEAGAAPNGQRRALLKTSVGFSLAATILHALPASATLCVDPEELSSADYSFRKYVQYTESSPKANQSCSNCASFKPSQSECGSCQVVAGSINAHGYCNGWSARVDKR
jgi:hypothetical protein